MRRAAVACVALTMVAACGAPQTGGPLPTVASSHVVRSAADLHCALPVDTGHEVGFVDFPSGRFSADPTGPKTNLGLLFYSFGAGRWAKIFSGFGSQLISPDGKEFVEANPGPIYSPPGSGGQGYTDVYARSVITPGIRELGRVAGRARPIAWLAGGIYLDNGSIVRFDPVSGKSVELHPKGPDAAKTAGGLWFWITSTAAWYGLAPFPNQGDQNSIYSMSLLDGSLRKWLTAPAGRSVSIIGFLGPEEPLVVEYNTEPYTAMTGVKFMQLARPGAAQDLRFDSSINAWGFTDSMGVWLESPGHLWLYDRAGLIPMADLSGAIGGDVPAVAGLCR